MTIEFGHEGLTKPHHFPIGLTFWIEVSAALAAPDGKAGERIFKSLLETEKLQD